MTEPQHWNKPIVVDETAGKKAYCQCRHSANLPYCDGAHGREGAGVGPIVVDLMKDGKIAVCQCRRSGDLPWCDGAHSKPV